MATNKTNSATENARKVADQINEEFKQVTHKTEKLQKSITESARDIWLAGLGLFSTLEEEGEKMFNSFLEKGKDLEKKGETFEKRAKERLEAFQSFFVERTDKMSKEIQEKLNASVPTVVEEKFQEVLDKVGVSTKAEVQELNKKVDKLTKAVEELAKKLGESGATKKESSTKK